MDKKDELEKKIRALLAMQNRSGREAAYLEGVLAGLIGPLSFSLIEIAVRQLEA